MPYTYITANGSLTVPDESERPLDTYHNAIEQRINVNLHGLTGRDNAVRRVVVSDELSDSNQTDVEDYLKSDIELVQDDLP